LISSSELSVLMAINDPPAVLTRALRGHKVEKIDDSNKVLDYVSHDGYDLVLLDSELDKVKMVKGIDPRLEIILISEHKIDINEALKSGVSACFNKRLEMQAIQNSLKKISDLVQLRRETEGKESELLNLYTFAGLVGKNPQFLEILTFIQRIAPYYKSVLICGETGTGKEVIARALHFLSTQNKHPLVTCNCPSFGNT
jgi:DNA-binding NtrC family response regulator